MFLRALLILLITNNLCFAADYHFNYSPLCKTAYQQYMALQFEEGTASIMKEMKNDPYNLMATFLANYEDCLRLLFSGDEKDYERSRHRLDKRFELINRGSDKDPWLRLSKAGLYLHWAFVHLRMGENLRATVAFRHSFQLLKENRRLFPAFEYNDIFWGLETAAVGAIPEDYKWIAAIFGLKGDVKKGMSMLAGFINKHGPQDPMRNEAVLYYTYFRFYLMYQQQEAWNYLNSSQFPLQHNMLHMFVKTNIASNYRKADAAIQTIALAEKEKNYAQYPIMDFEMGAALLMKLNLSCINYFQKFLANYNGGFFVKDTWQKMAYAYYIKGDMQQANRCREKIKTEGTAVVDADKQALRFAKGTEWPHPKLLQARLLIDGGYYKQALEKINGMKEAELNTTAYKLEHLFRMGRIYDELEDDNRAVQYYQQTIDLGRNRTEHFAARAALQTGFIYERQKKFKAAIAKYKECVAMDDHDYKNSIDQQAKAGINRLEQ
jgi:hypothetical protein